MTAKKQRFWLEMLPCCKDVKALAARASVPANAVYGVSHGKSIRPITMGKSARVNCIAPAALIEQEVDE